MARWQFLPEIGPGEPGYDKDFTDGISIHVVDKVIGPDRLRTGLYKWRIVIESGEGSRPHEPRDFLMEGEARTARGAQDEAEDRYTLNRRNWYGVHGRIVRPIGKSVREYWRKP